MIKTCPITIHLSKDNSSYGKVNEYFTRKYTNYTNNIKHYNRRHVTCYENVPIVHCNIALSWMSFFEGLST